METLTFKEALEEKEVYLVAGDEDSDAAPIYMFKTVDDLEAHLAELKPTVDACTRVLHGVLTSAEYIPANFFKRTAFLVCVDPDDATNVTVVESAAMDAVELSTEIETFLTTGFHLQTLPDIEDVFVFYGYELSTCLAVVLDDIDEEALERCQKVAEAARRLGPKEEQN